ncbi:MAG: S-methyl-5'-thioadenosine phosphorylase [Dehalococcoidia bacterium]|nr:MAG: S-methyl-5'-thioadenosine phosphorylase [Dehalococcoidia bacterium]
MVEGPQAAFGVIGGSGFYEMPGLADARAHDLDTPFGRPSSAVTVGSLHGRPVAFIARHGEGHRILPQDVPSRANIYALKMIGVTRILAVSAVGSLREDIHPLDAVIPDQAIDRTAGRPSTFFGDGAVAHVGFADPFCPGVATALADAVEATGVPVHRGGTLVVINGPAFSTRAESHLYRQWGADIIGMTAIPEAKLAREVECCYASLCFVTDYDVWRHDEEDVTASMVAQRLNTNITRAREAIAGAVATLGDSPRACACGDALASAIIASRDRVPSDTRQRLGVIVRRYWGAA